MPEIEIDLSKPLRDTTHPKYLPSPGGRGGRGGGTKFIHPHPHPRQGGGD